MVSTYDRNENQMHIFTEKGYKFRGLMKRAVKWTSTDDGLEKCSLVDVNQEKCSGVDVDHQRSTFMK